jgi:hypothetical protein
MTIWYNVGTATATNGSTAVTGSLTAWLANVKPGDEFYFIADARGYEVASVEENTALTLATAYQGTTGSGKSYATKQIGPGWHLVTELSVAVADLVSAADNVITNGVGVPSDTEGNDGDTYIRTDTPSIYAKESGTWVLKASLSGPTGATGPSYQATSTTSLAIGTGSKSFTTQASRGYTVGQRLRASSSASTSNYMEGVVTSYSSTTLVLNVDRTGGSGTIASWNINITGDAGPANSLAIGSVTASTAGSNAEATITGTAPSQTLNLVLPRGNTGPANVLSIGTVESGESAAASITGDAPTQTLNLTLPQGDAATIEVGSVTTVGPEDSATVTNSGTSAAAVFDFEIPQGEPGVSVNHRGEYSGGTEYSFNDEVLDNGSTWRFVADTPATGQAPPTLPTTSNDYWQLSAQRGVDGTGAVNTVNSQSPDITGDVVLSASDIEVAHIATEYTPSGSSINDHLAAIDTRFGESSAGAAPDETIASASTVDLGSTTDLYIEITGTTTITSFGTTPNIWRIVRFAGALTLTHNGTSLILPGAANITTAASDTAIFVSDGSGNWRCVDYQRSNGRHLNISSYISGLLDDANAAAALTTLGVSSFAQTVLDDTTATAARTTLGVNTLVAGTSSDYTVLSSDRGQTISVNASGASRTITLLAAATAGDGFEITIRKSDSSTNTVTIDGNSSETIDGATTYVLRLQYNCVTLRCDGSNWFIVQSHLPAQVGSNANGRYVREANGYQKCWSKTGLFTAISITGDNGAIFFSSEQTWTYPASFAEVPNVTGGSIRNTGTGLQFFSRAVGTLSTSAASFRLVSSIDNDTADAWIEATGVWYT